MKYNDWLRSKDLIYKENILHFADMRTLELIEKFRTPIYVISERMIKIRYRELKKLLDSIYQKNQIYYAVKANSNLSILKILSSEGSNFDCSSTGEIYSCLSAGISPDQIIYTGNMFTNEDFEFSIENNILINLDSISQLDRLVKIYEKSGKSKDIISFRFNPEIGAGHHPHTITAGKEIKFGILEEQLIKAYSKAQNLGFKRFGIHQHIGSGILNPKDFQKPAQKFLHIIREIAQKLEIQFEFVDFGGGIGIPYRPEEEAIDLTEYGRILFTEFKDYVKQGDIGEPSLYIEPGRYISAEAGIILTQVNTIKNNGYKRFAGINVGFNTLIRPTMYGAYHHIIPCIEKNTGNTQVFDVVGPICESGDVIGKSRTLQDLSEGDYLAILDAGAYGFTMSSNYNSRPRSAEILVSKGQSYKIRKEESFDDLIRNESIPDYLK